MKNLINSEYRFTKKVGEKEIYLTVYINYNTQTYDIMQDGEEGIFPRNNNYEVAINLAYMELAIEALKFIESELYLVRN